MSEAAQQQQQEQQQQEQQQPQKPSKKRNLRQKRALEEDHEADEVPEVQTELLQDLKLLQKQRKRVPGVDANKLVPAATAEDDAADNELMDAQYVKAEVNVKSQILDEDAHMQRYVEQQLAARLGKSVDDLEQKLSKQEQEELELYRLPEGLQASLTHEVSLPGMMTAITEVEVSKEAKMRKIEETEAVKARMLAKKTGRDGEGVAYDAGGMNVRRGMFAFSFGKQQKRQLDMDPDQLREQRRYITDRTKDPKDLARLQKRKGQQ